MPGYLLYPLGINVYTLTNNKFKTNEKGFRNPGYGRSRIMWWII
jgi:hypothetical protein